MAPLRASLSGCQPHHRRAASLPSPLLRPSSQCIPTASPVHPQCILSALVCFCVHVCASVCMCVHLCAFSSGGCVSPLLSLTHRSGFSVGPFSSGVAMEERGLPGEGAVDSFREKRVPVTSRGLAEGRERLEKMELMLCQDSLKVQRELNSMKEVFKGLEEEQASWRRERESMVGELCKLRSEVEKLQAAVAASAPQQICDVDRGSEEIDLKALAEHKWLESRQVLAPITPEAVRARTPVAKQGASGKENIRSNAEEILHLRRENEHYREKTNKLSKENKGLKSQYYFLSSKLSNHRLGLKGDVGQLTSNQDQLQAALEASLEKPSKIRRRSPVEAQAEGGGVRSPSPSSDMNAPSTPLPPQTVAEIVTRPTGSTSGYQDRQAKVKAEPVHLESLKELSQIPSTKDSTAGEFECKSDRATDNSVPTAMAVNRKRSLESLGKQPSKPPAFKFVEPVRKKAERENLQATECKLCKKFYDAVIGGDANGLAESRCTHVDKSRHRFRDLPPATPEGFWNIGFDSDF